ncbi:MAG: TerL [Nevskiales bacterium]
MIEYHASKTLTKFHKSDAFVRGVLGPIGSGKSVACCWELFSKANTQAPGPDKVRRSRWAVIRNTYRELSDTTLKTWQDWFGKAGTFHKQDMRFVIEHGMPDGTKLELEVLFRALDRPDDVKKLLSLELTGAWVNEAREVPKGVIDMLQGRVGRFPSQRDGGPSWFGVIMDTNPPDNDHWWYDMFEEAQPDGWALFRQPSGLAENAENIENLPRGYYERMVAGKTDEWINVYVHGEYGFLTDGRPIYPEFVDSVHVAPEPLRAQPGTVYVGIDFGLTPAAVFGQRDVMGRWYWLDELVTENMGATRFGELLGRHIRQNYPNNDLEIYGDPAGEQHSQVDERTPFQVLQAKGIDAIPAPSNDWLLRREAVAIPMTRMIDGKAGLIISPTCKIVRKGMGGGYCYRRLQVAGDERYTDKPDKNRFSHPCEAAQYMMLGAGEGDSVVGTTSSWGKPLNYGPTGIV